MTTSMRFTLKTGALGLFMVLLLLAVPLAAANESSTYKGGSTAVAAAQNNQDANADDGLVICSPGDASTPGTGQGGGCFGYAGHGGNAWSIHVRDNAGPGFLAYRVCLVPVGASQEILNEDDGTYTYTGDCDDPGYQNTFSHKAGNNWADPHKIIDGTYEWIIVFLCEAVMDSTQPHVHSASTGTIYLNNTAGMDGYVPPQALCGGAPGSTHRYIIQGVVKDPTPNPPPVRAVPTLSQWGMTGLAVAIVAIGMVTAKRRAP